LKKDKENSSNGDVANNDSMVTTSGDKVSSLKYAGEEASNGDLGGEALMLEKGKEHQMGYVTCAPSTPRLN